MNNTLLLIQEVPDLQALLRFVRFGLPWDFGRTITIARGDARPAVTIHGRGALWEGRAGKATQAPRAAAPPRGRQAAQRATEESERRLRIAPARRTSRQTTVRPSPRLPQGSAATSRSDQQCGKRECRQYPGLKRTRASANTSGPDSTLARRPLVKLRSP